MIISPHWTLVVWLRLSRFCESEEFPLLAEIQALGARR